MLKCLIGLHQYEAIDQVFPMYLCSVHGEKMYVECDEILTSNQMDYGLPDGYRIEFSYPIRQKIFECAKCGKIDRKFFISMAHYFPDANDE